MSEAPPRSRLGARWPRSLAATLCLLAGACEQDPRGAIDLDSIDEPAYSCVVVDHETLDIPGALEIHAFVADEAEARGGWALITYEDPQTLDVAVALARVPGDEDEVDTPLTRLDLPPYYAEEAQLRAGLGLGSAWLLLPKAESIHGFAVGEGLVASNELLGNFPSEDSGSCSGGWQRQLLLFEGQPFIFALPSCTDGPAFEPELLELDPDTLGFVTSWVLSFDPCAGADDPQLCATQLDYYFDDIIAGGSSQLPGAGRVPVAFSYVRRSLDDQVPELPATNISVLELRLSAEGPDARLLTFPGVWVQSPPPPLGPIGLTQDLFSIQLHVRSQAQVQDETLLRLDTITDIYALTREFVPLPGRGQLIQLADQSAMMAVDDDDVLAVPLVDYPSWPQWRELSIRHLDHLKALEPAGPGHLLLRRDDGAPQVIRIRCLDADASLRGASLRDQNEEDDPAMAASSSGVEQRGAQRVVGDSGLNSTSVGTMTFSPPSMAQAKCRVAEGPSAWK